MAIKVQMPKLSDTMEEGKILKWLKKEGDQVEQGEVIAEVESDKADMELEAFDSGTLLKIVVPEGKGASVGNVIAIIGEEGEKVDDLLKEDGEEKKEVEESKKEEKDEEKEEGKEEKKKEPEKEKKEPEKEQPKREEPERKPAARDDGAIKASPLARKMADEHGIDLKALDGSGPEGRIVKRDIEKAIEEGVPGKAEPAAPAGEPVAETIELTGMRKAIARRMVESKTSVPHFYLTVEIDMTRIMEARKRINDIQEESKVSFTDIMIKIAAQALLKHPRVNSYWAEDSIKRRGDVNIGIAVALDDGLITPVVRNCDKKGIIQISKETKDYAERARNRKLQPEEYEGGSITISNLGMYDIEEFSAIINPPESSILATGAIVEKPVVRDGQLAVGRTMRVTMSCDHRVVDGAVGAEFLRDFKRMLEDPLVTML